MKELYLLANPVRSDEYPMRTLMVGVVTSYPFTHRRVITHTEAPKAK
jgi:hypothetical protein